MRHRLHLSQNRFLYACHTRARSNSRLWLVYLPESGASFHTGSRTELRSLIGREQAERFHYLVINKPGLTPAGKDSEVFERSFRRRLRIEDALYAIEAVIPRGDRICLLGYSEGAYLAPELALRLGGRRVVSLALIGGGTRGWLDEELSQVEGRAKAALCRQVERIRRDSRSLEKWHGFSYATWNSYDSNSTLRALSRLPKDLPVLSLLGARDRVIDFAAAERDLRSLASRRSVQVQVFPRCGHSFSGHWHHVRRAFGRFLAGAVDIEGRA